MNSTGPLPEVHLRGRHGRGHLAQLIEAGRARRFRGGSGLAGTWGGWRRESLLKTRPKDLQDLGTLERPVMGIVILRLPAGTELRVKRRGFEHAEIPSRPGPKGRRAWLDWSGREERSSGRPTRANLDTYPSDPYHSHTGVAPSSTFDRARTVAAVEADRCARDLPARSS